MTYPDWLDRGEYPFQGRYLDLPAGRMHYLDEGAGEALLMVHGTPEWSFVYRKLVTALAPRYRCLVPDQLGFGLSDRPADYSYAPAAQAASLERFIEAQQLDRMTLLVHDFGGPIGLAYALAHPERVRGLIILNSWLWSLADTPRYRLLDTLFRGSLGRWLYLDLNISPRLIMPAAGADRATLPPAIHQHYLAPFPSRQSRRPLLAYARALVGASDFYQDLWERREAIAELPTLIVWGMKDPAFGPRQLTRMEGIFRRPETVRLERVGHFPQEEAPAQVLAPLEAFLGRIAAS